MSLPKVAILGFHKNSHWSSLRIIKQRWEGIYQNLSNATLYSCDLGNEPLPEAEIYVLLDHRLPSQEILKKVAQTQRPIWWHIHGDLTIRVKEFFEALKLLGQQPLQFVVASEAQRKLLLALLPTATNHVSVIPYPIAQSFQAVPAAKQHWKELLGIPRTHRVIGYAGRWSKQKGVVDLLQAVRLLDDPTLHVLLAGHFDDLGFAQLTGEWVDARLRQSFPKLVGERVHVIPTLKPEQMPDFLAALDAFVCSGCFHDEDFNLTAAEALSVGTPCILSAWGGHLDHAQREPKNVTLLKPVLTPEGYQVPLATLVSALQVLTSGQTSHAYPVAATLPIVPQNVLSDTASNALALQLMSKTDFLSEDGKLNQRLYQDLYQHYV